MDRDMAHLAGGDFLIGTDEPTYPEDGEGPVRPVRVASFWIDTTAVTNAEFAAFVGATSHQTDAERLGWSFVFGPLLGERATSLPAVAQAPWWRRVDGADFAHPEGPGSSIEDRSDHPVVHVSWNDARAYCAWAGLRLPTEVEWEYAARGGLVGRRFPWGDELTPGGEHRMNVWQGSFPDTNTLDDGYLGTAPVRSYPPNGYGLYEMTGNVWEWTADARGEMVVTKGGSYLCHASYCNRYRVAARGLNAPDDSTGNIGFRCARDT